MFGVIQALNTTDGDFICYISSKYSYVDHLSKKKKKLFFYQLKYAGRFDRALTFWTYLEISHTQQKLLTSDDCVFVATHSMA